MRQHYTPKPDREDRASAALDILAAISLGVALSVLGLAYFDILWS
jgi:hypothetical protein